MAIVKRESAEFDWIVSPLRQEFKKRKVKQEIELYQQKNTNASHINIDNGKVIRVAFSDVKRESLDFAATLNSRIKVRDYVYVEKRTNDYLLIHIKDGVIRQDRLLTKAQTLQKALYRIASAQNNNNAGEYVIETFSIAADEYEQLGLTAIKATQCNAIDRSYLDSLDFDDRFVFMENEAGMRQLMDNGVKQWTIGTLAACVIAYFGVAELTPKPIIEKIEKTNPFLQYNAELTTKIAATARLRDDMLAQKHLNETLVGWRIINVMHDMTGVHYAVVADEKFKPTVESLREYASQYGLITVNTDGIHYLHLPLNQVAVYKTLSDTHRFNMTELRSDILDNAIKTSKYFRMQTGTITEREQWLEQSISVEFNQATLHDLGRLAAIFEGDNPEEPYPIVIEESKYQINRQQRFSGSITVKIYGV